MNYKQFYSREDLGVKKYIPDCVLTKTTGEPECTVIFIAGEDIGEATPHKVGVGDLRTGEFFIFPASLNMYGIGKCKKYMATGKYIKPNHVYVLDVDECSSSPINIDCNVIRYNPEDELKYMAMPYLV